MNNPFTFAPLLADWNRGEIDVPESVERTLRSVALVGTDVKGHILDSVNRDDRADEG